MPDCFVISPIGKENDPERKRADEVLQSYIAPACRLIGWSDPVRSEEELSPSIVQNITRRLQTAKMVVAYLGRPPWNENVLIEVGYRQATGLPIVFLHEAPEDGEDAKLPFDLADQRVIFLPPEKSEADKVAATVRKLQATMAERLQGGSAWSSPHAIATISMHLNSQDRTQHMFLDASPEAERLFDINDLVSVKFEEFFAKLQKIMPDKQYQAFNREQSGLIKTLITPETPLSIPGLTRPPVARTPIIFNDEHSRMEYRGRAYLPIIIQYYKSTELNLLKLRVLYIDVTTLVEERKDQPGHFICPLFDHRRKAAGPNVGRPAGRPAGRRRVRRVFLAHNTGDARAVAAIAAQLGKRDIQAITCEGLRRIDELSEFENAVGAIVPEVACTVVFSGPSVADIWRDDTLPILKQLNDFNETRVITARLPDRSEPNEWVNDLWPRTDLVFDSVEDDNVIDGLVARINALEPTRKKKSGPHAAPARGGR